MQSYPSPNALAADGAAPFYSSASSQHHPALSSPDDLQLTAQLSRGLAPIMNAGAAGAMTDNQDARNQDALNHQYEQDPDAHRHPIQLQANHGSMDQMGGQYAAPDGSTAPRKRSKVSRACDECRRKKIRCDATGEPGDEQCSSCKRVGARCQFSRVPMKRGPSKGYIKELADRLNTLEGAMQAGEIPVAPFLATHSENPMQRRASDEFSPPPNPEGGPRKRTYSSLSTEFSTPYQPQRPPSGWASQELPRHSTNASPAFTTPQPTPGPVHMFREPNYSPNGLQPTPQWRKPPEVPRPQSSSFEGMLPNDQSQLDHTPGWDDALIEGYINTIHPTYPILHESKSKLKIMVSDCSAPLKEAFYEALYSAVRSFPSPNDQGPGQQSIKKASQLIITSQFDNASAHSFTVNLVYLQTMMLLVIATENLACRGQAGLSSSVWLGSAVGLAYSLKLHLHKQNNVVTTGDDLDTEKLSRRLWWSLVIMDRWHASSSSSPLMIPDGSVVVYPDDQTLLGESLYHLARLSVILGHFAMASLAPTDLPSLSVPPNQIIDTLLRGELERWRESLPPSIFPPSNSPLVHLCYWSLRILMELRLPDIEPYGLLTAAMNIVTQLTHNSTLITPLTHHATLLCALALIELTASDNTRNEAEGGLKSLLESQIAPSSCVTFVRELITKKLRPAPNVGTSNPNNTNAPESQHDVTSSQNLQRLADLATATEGAMDATVSEGRKEGEKSNFGATSAARSSHYHDLRKTVRGGYLGVLHGEDLDP
ncbi:hypothetical protein G7Y89_g6986 [Cudoniella acicularis]|uniref:Zn(2)-C6 fungal-type domain-containing protein n=1 Tax=Cudoniella acicularis TaxID=354080 RepID=A0A8H4W1Y5_9HELO|nr:hypothetical protein G7Y89_g6986 [Cudoniella acicularis]